MLPVPALRLASVALVASVAVAPASNSTPVPAAVDRSIVEIAASELRAHVETLASDELSGRVVGHDGNRRAVEYVAEALRRARVTPASSTYLQPFELYQASLNRGSRLTVVGPKGEPVADLGPGADFYPLPQSSDVPVTAPLVFAGHGISVPEWRYDDYRRRRAKGAIVLAEEGVPASFGHRPGVTDARLTELSTVERKLADARAHGAVGLIVVRMSGPDAQTVWPPGARRRDAAYRLYSTLAANPMAAAAISGHAAGPIRRTLNERTPLVATLRPDITIHRTTVHNVIASLEPGTPTSDGMVVVGAHLDHDGVDDEGRVFNGADDNASGTAAVLAMADAFTRAAAAGERPRRRIVFALWNAEEKGSLGVEAFLAAPVPAGRVIANLNLDMIGRAEDVPDPDDPRLRGFRRTAAGENANVVHLLGYSFSPDLAAVAGRANQLVGLTLKREYDEGAQGLLRRSDHWPFLKRGIPALFFTTGLHPDYHTPNDDTERLDFRKLERITELVSRVAWMVADGEPPRFRKNR